METKTHSLSRVGFRLSALFVYLFVFSFFLSACGPTAAAPTPTPTKTPVSEVAQVAVETPVAPTATPEPPTATPELPTPEPPTPTPQPGNIAPFTGLPIADPARLKDHPIFICINNDAPGRSAHFGLNSADLVYEYIVDGFSITRITAMYHSQDAARVGPVRSARFPNIWMTYMYDGSLACSGSSDGIRYLLKNEVGFPYLDADIDDPSNTVYYTSVGSDYRTRMQASTEGVRRWLADVAQRCVNNPQQVYCQKVINNLLTPEGSYKTWNRPGFDFSETPADFNVGTASTIRLTYPGGNSVEWRYDPNRNVYIRFQGGAAHVDDATGQQIAADNVIVITAAHELTNIVEDSLGTKGVDVKLYGFGDLRVFRNGRVYEGTWRASDQTPPRWLGPGEQPIPLKPGQSWVQVIQDTSKISYE
jgi:hypothetical protein